MVFKQIENSNPKHQFTNNSQIRMLNDQITHYNSFMSLDKFSSAGNGHWTQL
jgi:hypothetical protein